MWDAIRIKTSGGEVAKQQNYIMPRYLGLGLTTYESPWNCPLCAWAPVGMWLPEMLVFVASQGWSSSQ